MSKSSANKKQSSRTAIKPNTPIKQSSAIKQVNAVKPSIAPELTLKSDTTSGDLAIDATASEELTDKPVRYIVQNLERAYGVPQPPPKSAALDMLVQIILSQATSDVNSQRAFAALKQAFPSYELLLRAAPEKIEATIRSGGLAKQKTRTIQGFLTQLKAERANLDLSFLNNLSTEQAVAYLQNFRGLGPKTIACTLLFALHKPIFPLDTHIFRILRRVGLIPAKCSDARAHNLMNLLTPPGKHFSFHVNLIRHGRRICRPREPLCERCPIVEYCDYGQAVI